MISVGCLKKGNGGYDPYMNDVFISMHLFRPGYDIKLLTQIEKILGIKRCLACNIFFELIFVDESKNPIRFSPIKSVLSLIAIDSFDQNSGFKIIETSSPHKTQHR